MRTMQQKLLATLDMLAAKGIDVRIVPEDPKRIRLCVPRGDGEVSHSFTRTDDAMQWLQDQVRLRYSTGAYVRVKRFVCALTLEQ